MDEVVLFASYVPESAGGRSLPSAAIDVWAVPLNGDAEPWATVLSPEERLRVERFRVADHRRRYTIAHGALRAILAGYGKGDPLALEFGTGPRGKPFLAQQPELCFNLSHSGQLALIAVGARELGIDLEKMRHLESQRDIARRHFAPGEFAALEALPDADQRAAFYRCWTRKEAYIKAVGAGLSMPLDVFEVSLGDDASFVAFRDGVEDPATWLLADVSPGPDYAAALAVKGPGTPVHTLRLATA
jgi:4'-phosphopantetheinyl transferase